jgi:hypothetical protein
MTTQPKPLCIVWPALPHFVCMASIVVVVLAAQSAQSATNSPTTLPPFAGNLTGEAPAPAEPLSLWYRQPAMVWTSALPVGNGRQGAMMFGGIDSEVLCLNEDTLWAGGPYTPDNPEALLALRCSGRAAGRFRKLIETIVWRGQHLWPRHLGAVHPLSRRSVLCLLQRQRRRSAGIPFQVDRGSVGAQSIALAARRSVGPVR